MVKKSFVAAAVALGLLSGCKTASERALEQVVLASPPELEERIHPLTYAEVLRDDRADELSTFSEERKFEERYGINVKCIAPSAEVLDQISEVLEVFPAEARKRFRGYDLVLAGAKHAGDLQSKIAFEVLKERGHHNQTRREIVLFREDRDAINHEFAHAAHITHPEYAEINRRIEGIKTKIDDKIITLGELLARKDLLGELVLYNKSAKTWADGSEEPRYGLPSAYAANNIRELVAEVVETIHGSKWLLSNQDEAKRLPQEEFQVMREVARVLRDFDCLDKLHYAEWDFEHRRHFQSREELLQEAEKDDYAKLVLTRNIVWFPDIFDKLDAARKELFESKETRVFAEMLDRAPLKPRYEVRARELLNHESKGIREEAVRYLIHVDSVVGIKEHNELLERCKSDVQMRKLVAETLQERDSYGIRFDTYREFIRDTFDRRAESRDAERAANAALRYSCRFDDGTMCDVIENTMRNSRPPRWTQAAYNEYCERIARQNVSGKR